MGHISRMNSAINLKFGMDIALRKKSKKSNQNGGGCHGYLMTSSQSAKIAKILYKLKMALSQELKELF